MQQMTGVTVDRAWTSSSYTSRGLPIVNARFDGGAPTLTSSVTGNLDTAIFDSIALVRGADGLFGAGEAGGVINFSRKRALEPAQARASMTFGSWGRARVEGDLTGALTADGSLRARVVGVYDMGRGFQDYKSDSRWLGHGSLEFNPTPNTLIVAGYSHQSDRHEGFVVSLPRYRNGQDINFPRSTNMGAPWSWIEREIDVVYGRVEQQLGGNWIARVNANYGHSNEGTNAAEMENAVDPVDQSGTDWWYYQSGAKVRELGLDFNVTGDFSAFGQKHELIVGVDYTWNKTDNRSLWTYADTGQIYRSQANLLSAPRPGVPLGPVTGTNYEAGIKGEFLGGRLQGALAVYRVTKRGASARDPSNPPSGWTDPCCYICDGSLLSQGFEAEINGEILPNLQLSVGYTYNENENKRANDASFAEITPRHLLKVFANYRFREGALKGVSFGGGVSAHSSNFRSGYVQALNPATGLYDGPSSLYQFKVPGYSVWSLRAGYDMSDNISISANINNLFDKTYYATIGTPGYGNFYGDRRHFLISLRGKF